jgi:hypothetical protein
MLDSASVQAAVEGCHSIVNAATVYSLDPGEAKQVLRFAADQAVAFEASKQVDGGSRTLRDASRSSTRYYRCDS